MERDSVVGEIRRMHDEQSAEEVLIKAAGSAGFNLAEKDLLRKNDERKAMVAWLLAKRTAVRQEWIAERLGNAGISWARGDNVGAAASLLATATIIPSAALTKRANQLGKTEVSTGLRFARGR